MFNIPKECPVWFPKSTTTPWTLSTSAALCCSGSPVPPTHAVAAGASKTTARVEECCRCGRRRSGIFGAAGSVSLEMWEDHGCTKIWSFFMPFWYDKWIHMMIKHDNIIWDMDISATKIVLQCFAQLWMVKHVVNGWLLSSNHFQTLFFLRGCAVFRGVVVLGILGSKHCVPRIEVRLSTSPCWWNMMARLGWPVVTSIFFRMPNMPNENILGVLKNTWHWLWIMKM